jgi:hypothetical protein
MIHRIKEADVSLEPVGIVISGGRVEDTPPRFAAFIWGPVPDADSDTTTSDTTTTKAA